MSRLAAQIALKLALIALWAAAASASERANASSTAIEWFETRIRPVLAASCYECHSAEADDVGGGLRLDTAAGIRRGGDGGEILVAGEPQASRLLAALRYEDLQMPPSGPLPDKVIEDFRHWIQLGAPLPDDLAADARGEEASELVSRDHWAFQPPIRPPLPAAARDDWCQSSIDAFVLARLREQGLSPSPPTDRATLARRLYFDLIGLPPTADEIERFVRDPAPDAVGALVDRLLSSPQYGERWGRHWLDVARYADTKDLVLKFGADRIRPYAYTYRDYVIAAWNRDLPFDRFVHEQLAADLLEPVDRSSLAALGLLNVGRLFDNNLPDIHDDRIDVVTRGFMGLTVACARCHDHKYDPIPTADYYSLYGVFANCEVPLELPLVADVKESDEVKTFEQKADEIRRRLADHLDTQYGQLLDEARQRVTDYLIKIATSPQEYLETSVFYMSLSPEDLRPQIVSRWRRYVSARSRSDDPVFGFWAELLSSPAAREAGAESDFAAQAQRVHERWSTVTAGTAAGQFNPLIAQVLSSAPLHSAEHVARAYGAAFLGALERWNASGRQMQTLDPATRQLVEILVAPSGPVHFARQHAYLYMSRVPRERFEGMQDELDKLAVTSAAVPPRAMVVADSPESYEPRIFVRGNPNTPGRPVPRQFLSVLARTVEDQPFGPGSGRRELAEAITSPHNPLTSRVLVNRVWMHHFGEPLVATPSDFGLRGSAPTHPALLDYLAWTLQHEDGWSIKKLHRRIILSSAYQQSSWDRPECRQLDPDNRWLWRAHRRRLDLEPMRDAMLAVAGRIHLQIGGRPVDAAGDPENRRRTIYGLVDRQELPAAFRAFDFASPDQSAARRPETTTPQQALFGLNSPFVINQARAIAASETSQVVADDEGIKRLYRRVLARQPTSDELALAREFLSGDVVADETAERTDMPPDKEWNKDQGHPATDSAVTDAAVTDAGAAETAANNNERLERWTRLAQLLLLTNEFMFID